MKTEVVAWKDFFDEKPVVVQEKKSVPFTFPITTTVVACLLLQDFAHAQMMSDAIAVTTTTPVPVEDGWDRAKHAILHILDYVSYGVIVFCGGSWMFGHKNKALDALLSCGVGVVIIRHADDIEQFFKSI